MAAEQRAAAAEGERAAVEAQAAELVQGKKALGAELDALKVAKRKLEGQLAEQVRQCCMVLQIALPVRRSLLRLLGALCDLLQCWGERLTRAES